MAVVELNKENFKETIVNNPFVVVDFWAPWCEPCVGFTPVIEAAAEKNPDILFGMVNTEENPEIAEYFEVSKIPGILIFVNKPVSMPNRVKSVRQHLIKLSNGHVIST